MELAEINDPHIPKDDDINAYNNEHKHTLRRYIGKIMATAEPHPMDRFRTTPRRPWPDRPLDFVACFVGGFLGTLAAAFITIALRDNGLIHAPFLTSFGASMTLFFANPNSPLTQPKNCFLGQIIATVVGLLSRIAITEYRWLSAAVSVSISICLMQLTGSIHPPAGATAFAAGVLVELPSTFVGYLVLIAPIHLGEVALFVLALLINNADPYRHYPNWWL